MMGGRIFKTMFAVLVILILVFPLLNVYGFTTAVKRKNYNAILDDNRTICNQPSMWWVKPKEKRVYLFDIFCFPFPVPGKILPKTTVIGPKITLTVGASEDVKSVKFYKWAVGDEFLMGSDDEPNDKHQFEFVFYPKHMFEYRIVAVGSNGKRIDTWFYAIPLVST